MAELRAQLGEIGLENVRSYIQSGNVVFESKSKSVKTLSKKIADCVEAHHGFRPHLLLFTAQDLKAAIDANPYPNAVDEPKFLHFYFLGSPVKNADIAALEKIKSKTEHFTLTDSVFYLHAPDGIGRSKLAANAEKHLGVTGTGRNFRTVDKIRGMVENR